MLPDSTFERIHNKTFQVDLFWIFTLSTAQWMLYAAGTLIGLYELSSVNLTCIIAAQVLLQISMYFLYRSAIARFLGVDTLLLIHLGLTGLIILTGAFFAEPYTLELSIFYIAVIFLGSRIRVLSGKLIISFMGIAGFFVLSILQGKFFIHPIESLWYGAGYIGICLLATVASIRTGNFINRMNDKSQQLQDALRLINNMTVKDEVTGLFNSRYIEEIILQQKSLSDRSKYQFSVALLSIDNIAQIESEHSTFAKQEVLKLTATIIQSHIRSIDSCGSWYGDRYMMVFVNSSLDSTQVALDRITLSIGDHNFISLGIEESLQLSCACCAYQHPESLEALIERTEKDMSQAAPLVQQNRSSA